MGAAELDAAEARYRKALKEKGPKDLDTLLARRDMAQILLLMRRFDEAKPILFEVLDGMSDLPENNEIRRYSFRLLYELSPPNYTKEYEERRKKKKE